MAIPSFFKQNKPRGFTYIPRYYDPVKEEMEQRRREWGKERGRQDEGKSAPEEEPSTAESSGDTARQPYRSRIMRGDMKNYFHHRKEKIQRQTTIRLIVILIIIVFVIYLYLRF